MNTSTRRKCFPEHLNTTNRKWKSRKRGEFRKVLKAIDEFRMGCAYTPIYGRNARNAPDLRDGDWEMFERLAKAFTNAMSVKNWGR